MSVPDNKLKKDNFVTYMLGFKIHMEQMAIAKFNIEKGVAQFTDASPGGGANEIK